jgi:HAD superfamily hydrolase (TIGR01509 family)
VADAHDRRPPLEETSFIFDLDGTLADTEPLAKMAWAATVSAHGHKLDQATVDALFGLRLTESAVLVRERFGLDASPATLARERDSAFYSVLPGRLRAMPGAHTVLEALWRRGIPCALATSGHTRHAREILRELGMTAYFQVVATGDQVARGKPEPDIVLLAARLLGQPAASCWVVEDAPNGVEAARRAGARVILIPNEMTRRLEYPPVDLRLGDLDELAVRLDEILARR